MFENQNVEIANIDKYVLARLAYSFSETVKFPKWKITNNIFMLEDHQTVLNFRLNQSLDLHISPSANTLKSNWRRYFWHRTSEQLALLFIHCTVNSRIQWRKIKASSESWQWFFQIGYYMLLTKKNGEKILWSTVDFD